MFSIGDGAGSLLESVKGCHGTIFFLIQWGGGTNTSDFMIPGMLAYDETILRHVGIYNFAKTWASANGASEIGTDLSRRVYVCIIG